MKIRYIDFATVLPIWRNQLWPKRISPIETHSAMMYMDAPLEMKNLLTTPSFFGCYNDDELIGVNSGHLCVDHSYRSRGLWVNENFRRRGIGKALLLQAIAQAQLEEALFVWSYPRKSSWGTYKSAGFELASQWEVCETSEANAYCIKHVK